MRKDSLANGQIYHILNRSIAGYKIFEEAANCKRFMQIIDLYRYNEFSFKYSNFLELVSSHQQAIINGLVGSPKMVEIIAYVLMPTHFHLILRQESENGITKYISKVLNSFSRYFNISHQRKGPLWEGHFRNILVTSDEQLLHLTRYIHLNPVSAGLIKKPEEWTFSSYSEYLEIKEGNLCNFYGLFEFSPKEYKKFVNDRISYQKELSKIKLLLMEDYSG